LVEAGWVEGEFADERAVEGHDADVEVGEVEPDFGAFVGAADSDVEELGVVAQ